MAAAHGAYYRIQQDEGSAQFRYWISQNKTESEKMCKFFNLQNDNMFIKEGSKLILDIIAHNQVFYVPMITKIFDMEESIQYDLLTDQEVTKLSQRTESLIVSDTSFITQKQNFNEQTHVKIRLLHNGPLNVDFHTK